MFSVAPPRTGQTSVGGNPARPIHSPHDKAWPCISACTSSVRPHSVRNAIAIARGYTCVVLPLIGAGSGGGKRGKVQATIEDELAACQYDGEVPIVRYRKRLPNKSVRRNGG